LVGHCHITINGKVVNVSSYILKPGDVVAVRERSKTLEVIANHAAGATNKFPWMDFDKTSLTGKFISVPERIQIPENIKEQLIVELYSK
jgi:small subunit ribosomal protein S4